MRIDSHQHFWKYNAARDSWITDEMSVLKRDFLPENLKPELQASAIGATIAVQADQSEDETLFLLQLAESHASIAGVVGWIDLCSPQVAERMQYFSRFEKLRGFRHIAQFRRWRTDKKPADCTYAQLEVVPPQEIAAIFGN